MGNARILDANGNPFAIVREDAVTLWQRRYANMRASYDAARTTNEMRNIWANADRLDADSANSREVRHTLISRSRYEVGNNAYADGIAQTITNDLIGIGPSLRMQTKSAGFNQWVELEWYLWCKAVDFARKLWAMGHAKHVDGEAFAVVARNPRVKHRVQIDLILREAEQCQTPFPPVNDPTYIDGVKLDAFGNPTFYEFLAEHPGATNRTLSFFDSRMVPADSVLHWFRLRRPGQHRGVPEMGSSLNVGAAARRWREATLASAETAADFSAMLESEMPADESTSSILPFDTTDIDKRMLVALPYGTKLKQLEAEQPTANYGEFSKLLINEMGRSVNMPRNKAAADSSDYNYASGRLDHGTYYDSLDVQRRECDVQVLDKLFRLWFDLAIPRFNWLGGDPAAVGEGARIHLWDWPKHRVADVEAEANANATKLKSGQVSIVKLKSEAGTDAEDEAEAEAEYFGITVEELKRRQFDAIYPPVQSGGAPAASDKPADDVTAAALSQLNRRGLLPKANGNGKHHAKN